MARKLPTLLNVIDLESTTWRSNGERPPNEYSDIIEIGIATLDISHETPVVGEKRSILVQPARSKVSEFCTELTTITQAMLDDNGIPLVDALKIIKSEYKGTDRVWCSWGDYDRKMFISQCEDYGITYKTHFGPRHINLKCLYSVMNHLSYELGMASALEREGIPLEGTHHRGHDDAFNIAKIAQRMFRK